MYYTYILKSKLFKKSYVGVSDNLDRRLQEHNAGKSAYTKRYIPWILIHFEKHTNRQDALLREKYLKSRSGRREMKKFFIDTV